MEHEKFIEDLGNKVIKFYNDYKVLPSLIIAQGILESGWGESELAKEYCNYFGLKYYDDAVCRGYGAVNMKTKEEYEAGHIVDIEAAFCIFNNVEESIKCLCKWYKMRAKYTELIGCTDYKRACQIVSEQGYATDKNYTGKLINIISGYNLTRFDNMVLPKSPKGWYVQVGYYEDKAVLDKFLERLSAAGFNYILKERED